MWSILTRLKLGLHLTHQMVLEPSKRLRLFTRSEKLKGWDVVEVHSFKLDHVIIDILHLFLRITDLLINLLIQDLHRHDGILKSTELNHAKHTRITSRPS